MADVIAAVNDATHEFVNPAVVAALEEKIRDVIGSALTAGANVTLTVNDAGNTITVAATGGGSTDPEVVRDTIAAALVAGTNVTITPNDAGDTITIAATGGGGGFSFTDPNADRIGFWDDSAGAFAPLTHSAPLTISGTTLSISAASDTAQGVVELATTAETTTGTDTARAVTPAGVKAVADTKAPLASPVFTGNPTAPTPATSDNDTSIATTAFVKAQNYVQGNLANAKGDLLVGLSDNTFDTIAAGSNGQVLTADSAVAAGVKWATPSGGGGSSAPLVPSPIASGDMLAPPFNGNATGVNALASGAWPGSPLYLGAAMSIDALGARIATTESVDAKLLLYNSDSAGNPNDLVATATINCSSAGWAFGTFSSVALTAGLYWGFIRTNGGSTVRFSRNNGETLQAYVGVWSGTGIDQRKVGADVGTYAAPSASLTPVVGLGDHYHLFAMRRA
jgi:hypothetical protein